MLQLLDNVHFTVNFRDGGTNYDATKTTTYVFSISFMKLVGVMQH